MKTVREVIQHKALRGVVAIRPSATMQEAAELMSRKNIGALLVVDEGEPVGLLTERDYLRKVAATGLRTDDVLVEEVMSSNLRAVPASLDTEATMLLMTQARHRHLLVEQDGEILGLVSIGDLVKDVLSEQRYVIEQLEAYIGGAPSA